MNELYDRSHFFPRDSSSPIFRPSIKVPPVLRRFETAAGMDEDEDERPKLAATEETEEDPLGGLISPISCKDGIINSLEDLLNYVASGWKYHVSNTDGVKQAWFKLDNATTRICSHLKGEEKHLEWELRLQIVSRSNIKNA
ncbi:unnamed protein product [Caenorhabditis auriculariae]|uniref:Uncharacterized protein n=1 Tax=Caenorhabditis auriculariae TaxID=2777116 RepID=A0A8S1HX63_9PELO|nr:unnamed protein product [Caenorhabditis auriculariae]